MTPANTAMTPLAPALAEALPRLYGLAPDPLLLELIEALSLALVRGELHLPLEGPAPEGIVSVTRWPGGHREALERSGWSLACPEGRVDELPPSPVLLTPEGLGWRRWVSQLETALAQLEQRAKATLEPEIAAGRQAAAVERAARRGGLDARQQRAVGALLAQRLVLLGGGPGTGKTTTVVQMLAAVLEERPGWRLHLAAPTGKAAARLRQAIGSGLASLPEPVANQLAAVPCTTLHRLLESRGDGFGRNRRHPLPLDLLVVDEVSMLDLPLTAALLEALPERAQLVLVGDPDQLPPVGPGAVLRALQTPTRRQALGAAAIDLETPYRNDGAVATAAARLRQDDLREFLAGLEALGPGDNLSWWPSPPPQLPAALHDRLRAHQRRLAELAAAWHPDSHTLGLDLLEAVEACVLLAPTRRGAWGVERINQGLLGDDWDRGPSGWPPGTPVLCQRNLPELGLANGDVGVVVETEGQCRLLFLGSEDGGQPGLRLVHPSRLAAAEAAYAITIHKSQGSQYRQVLVLLPPGQGGWDRRLLYTALTRARQEAVLITPVGQEWLPR